MDGGCLSAWYLLRCMKTGKGRGQEAKKCCFQELGVTDRVT